MTTKEIVTIEGRRKSPRTSMSATYRLGQQGRIPATNVESAWTFRKKEGR